MDIKKLEIGKNYILSHSHGQNNQTVKVLKVSEETTQKWGKYWTAHIEFVSDDSSKGLKTNLNTIECERYLSEIK